MDTKKKLTYGAMVIVMAVIAWMGYGMFVGDSGDAPAMTKTTPNPDIPKPAAFSAIKTANKISPTQPQPAMSEREMQLMKLQQETQTKYLAALSELQMLKVEKDIAETSKDISKAKLDTITAQKDIVDLLTPPKPVVVNTDYMKRLENQAVTRPPVDTQQSLQAQQAQPVSEESIYTVVSVSRLRGEWTAVIGSQGRLYNVRRGDVLAADGSVVSSINRNGVMLEKDGKQQKVSMVPII